MSIDLNNLSLKELKDLQAQVAKAVSSFEDRKKKHALAELEEKARELGFSLAELTGAAVPRNRPPASAKSENPADASDTGSGRARKPRWFDAALKSGKRPEDMAI